MFITAVIGSPHRNGNTALLAREVLKGAQERGAETREIFLPDYRIEYCRGCIGKINTFCLSTGYCNIDDDVNDLRAILLKSDGIVYASPSYGIMPTAMMKNFIVDRTGMYIAYTSAFAGKYFVGVSTCGGIGASKVAKELAYSYTAGFHANAHTTGFLGVKVGQKKIDDFPAEINKAYKLGEKLANDIRKNKKYPFQKLFDKFLIKIMIRKVILKNIYSNKDGIMKAVYNNLVRRKLINEI